jgi:hypothetical protein
METELTFIAVDDDTVHFKVVVTRKPEPPPRLCRICGETKDAWEFGRDQPLALCFQCELRVPHGNWPFLRSDDRLRDFIALPAELKSARSILWLTEKEIERQKNA